MHALVVNKTIVITLCSQHTCCRYQICPSLCSAINQLLMVHKMPVDLWSIETAVSQRPLAECHKLTSPVGVQCWTLLMSLGTRLSNDTSDGAHVLNMHACNLS